MKNPEDNSQPTGVLSKMIADVADMFIRFGDIEDRVSVLEEVTAPHESRLEDLELWQEKVDDNLERY